MVLRRKNRIEVAGLDTGRTAPDDPPLDDGRASITVTAGGVALGAYRLPSDLAVLSRAMLARRVVEQGAGIWILGLVLLVAGVVIVVVGRKQRAGTLPRNWFAGLRTGETMRSDAAWYAAHTATAGLVTGAGIVQVIAGAAVLVLQPSGEGTIAAIVLGGAAATLGLVPTAGVRGHRTAARVNQGGLEDRPRHDR